MGALSFAFAASVVVLAGGGEVRNLVQDADCESASAAWSMWQGTKRGVEIVLEKTPEGHGHASLGQKIVLPAPVSGTLTFGCRVKAEDLPDDLKYEPSWDTYSAEISVVYEDGKNEYVQLKRTPIKDADGWQVLAGSFTPPNPIKEICFFGAMRSSGRARYDDFYVYFFEDAKKARQGCHVETRGESVVLKNDYLECVFEPAAGGTCRSLKVLSTGNDYAGEKHHEGRLFVDRLRNGGICFDRVYKTEILRDTVGEAAFKLSVSAPEGYPFLEISKTFRLRENSSALECTYSYFNNPLSMGEQVFEPHFRLGWSPRGKASQCYWLPTSDGVRKFGPTGGDTYVTNAVAGWLATSDGVGDGLVCEFDYSHLAQEYSWLGGVDNTTAEWTFSPVSVAVGKSFDTMMSIYPTTGLLRPDGAENGVAVQIAAEKGTCLRVDFASDATHVLDAEVLCVRRDGKKSRLTRRLKFLPDGPVCLQTEEKREDLKAVRVKLYDGERIVHETDRVFVGGYQYRPKTAKVKPAEIKLSSLDLSMDVETPHTVWARPFAGGRPRTLFIMDYLQGREIVELAQRFDLDPRAVRFSDNWASLEWGSCDRFGRFGFEDANNALRAELGKSLDVVVVSTDVWKAVDEANRALVRKLLADGVGLVVIGDGSPLPEGLSPSDAGVSYVKGSTSPELLICGADQVSAFEGPSRAVRFDYSARGGLTPCVPYSDPEIPFRYQDYSLGVIARAIAWTAKMDVKTPASAEQEAVVVSVLPGFEIRHTFYRTDKGVCDWKCEAVHAKTDGAIASISLEARGSNACCRIKTEFAGSRRLLLELTDGTDRVLSRSDGMVEFGEATLNLDVPENPNGLLEVRATLYGQDGKPADIRKASTLLPVARKPDGVFPFAIGESSEHLGMRRYLWPKRAEIYRSLGFNELRFWRYTDNGFPGYAMKFGFAYNFPITSTHLWEFAPEYQTPYLKTGDRKYLCRKPCFNDPAFLAKDKLDVSERIRQFAKYSPVSYDAGDEGSLTEGPHPFDFCFCDKTLAAERKWLEQSYGSLAALNASWGTNFTSWASVVPQTEAEALATHARDRRWAAFADHRRFMELTYCGYFSRVKGIMDELSPGIPLDMSGTCPPNGWTGLEMHLLSSSIGIVAAYDQDNLGEIMRSWGSPQIKPWYGYGNEGPDHVRRVWMDALRFGNFGISYFEGMNVLQPDFTVPRQVGELVEATAWLRDGGGLLLKTLKEPRAALIHYSPSSVYAAQIEKRYDAFLAARDAWCRLLDDMSIPYRFVATAEIEDGELERTDAKILVLPASSSVSDAEVLALGNFAKGGGLIAGDDLTGVLDGHCNFRPSGSPLAKIAYCPDAATLRRYVALRRTGGSEDAVTAFRETVRSNLAPYLPRTDVDFEAKTVCGVRTFNLVPKAGGTASYLGFVREKECNGAKGTVCAKLSGKSYVYDLRKKTCLGNVDRIDVALAPCEATFFAVLPYEVSGITVKTAPSVQRGEAVDLSLEVKSTVGIAGCHPMKIEVSNPDGVVSEAYSRVVETSGGNGSHRFRLALNDSPGTWRVKATDYVSGKVAEASFTVKE